MTKHVLFSSAATLTIAIAALAAPQSASADDCLLDTDNDGIADATNDTDGGANMGSACEMGLKLQQTKSDL